MYSRSIPYFFMKVHKGILLFSIGILCASGIGLYHYVQAGDNQSNVSTEACFICGNNPRSLMPYYSKFKSIGIVNLETLDICDTEVRRFTEDGVELYHGGSSKARGFGEGKGIWSISSMPGRGVSNIKIHYGNGRLKLSNLKKYFCKSCMEVVRDSNAEDKSRTAFLVDFQSRELYPLNGTWMKNDYYIHVDHEKRIDGKVDEVLVVYVPQKEEGEQEYAEDGK